MKLVELISSKTGNKIIIDLEKMLYIDEEVDFNQPPEFVETVIYFESMILTVLERKTMIESLLMRGHGEEVYKG